MVLGEAPVQPLTVRQLQDDAHGVRMVGVGLPWQLVPQPLIPGRQLLQREARGV